MASFFDRFRGNRETSSAEIAKERLKLVLVSDRSDLPQDRLEEMQAEILEVIKRYVSVEELEVQIKIEQRQRKNYLVADIPLQRDRAYHVASENAPPPDAASPAQDAPDPDASPVAEEGLSTDDAAQADPATAADTD